MGPSIGRSIKAGFAAASKSWAGIGVFVGCWAIVLALVFFGVMLTRPPTELFQERPAFAPLPAPTESAPAETPSTDAPDATPTSPEAGTGDLFGQLSTADSPTPPTEEPAAVLAAPDLQAQAAQAEASRQDQLAEEWFGRAWPLLLAAMLILIVASNWINGGQIGYLARRVISGQASIADFFASANRSLVRLLGAMGVSLVGLVAFVLIGILIVAAVTALANLAPTWLDVVLGILGLVLGLGIVVVLIWLLVRLSFWLIAIVADGHGPIGGLKQSFRVSRGQWWKIAGLGLLAGLISYGIWLPFGLVEWLGSFAGEAISGVISIVSNVLGMVASLYIGFALLSAYIRFYVDAKTVLSTGAAIPPAA